MLKYYSYGKGKSIVLLHGFCENNTCFNKQVLFLKDHYNLITFDLPGFGQSDIIQNLSMDLIAQKLKIALDALMIKECIMLGHSMGGYVALAFAKLFPGYLNGFGLLHSTVVSDTEERKDKRKQVINFIRKNGKEPYIKNFIPTLFKDQALHQDDVLFFMDEAIKGPAQGIIEACKAMMKRERSIDLLAETDKDVFFAIGKGDVLIPEDDMFNQASLCKKSEICYLENSGHCSMVEESDKLNISIKKFVDRVFDR